MKIEQADKPIIFNNTQIPDVFFTEFLSQASGEAIKVYLYILFLVKYNKEIKITDMSKILNLSLKAIEDSLKYWEDLNVLTKKPTGFIINDLQEMELHYLYQPKLTSSAKDMEATEKNKYRAKAIENINNQYFQGVMSPVWYGDIDLWFKKYTFDEQVMIALFDYCFKKSALHHNYVQTVADAWSRNNIKTYTDLENHYEKQEKLNKFKKSVSKKLGILRPLTQYEEAYIEKWLLEFSFPIDVVEIALKRTTSKSNPSFDYIDKLLTDWHDRKLVTVSDVEKFLEERKQKNKDVKQLQKKTSYQNYDQGTYEDLDSLYVNFNKM